MARKVQLGVVVEPELADKIDRRSEQDGETVSSLCREALWQVYGADVEYETPVVGHIEPELMDELERWSEENNEPISALVRKAIIWIWAESEEDYEWEETQN